MSLVRSESSAAASSAEAASLLSNSLALKLRSHMQACASGSGGLASRMEALSSSIDGLSRWVFMWGFRVSGGVGACLSGDSMGARFGSAVAGRGHGAQCSRQVVCLLSWCVSYLLL